MRYLKEKTQHLSILPAPNTDIPKQYKYNTQRICLVQSRNDKSAVHPYRAKYKNALSY